MTRLIATLAAGLMPLWAGPSLAQDHRHGNAPGAAGSSVVVVSAVDVAEPLAGQPARVTTFELTFGPGASSPPHRHPGPVYGYVMEGEFETALDNGPTRLLKPGDSFYEPAMVLHSLSRNPATSGNTRVLAVLVHPRDAKELVIPEPAPAAKR